jgi:circadian clock protein KaiA
LSAPLTIAVLTDSTDLLPLLSRYLDVQRHLVQYFTDRSEFLAYIESVKHEVDCLVFDAEPQLLPTLNYLYERGLILPVVMLQASQPTSLPQAETANDLSVPDRANVYHPSEAILAHQDLAEIGVAIDKAISKFLSLTPIVPTIDEPKPVEISLSEPSFLLQQQRRLADKLKERLGYLAVYYKRNPRQFYRRLDREQQQQLLDSLKLQYRQIVLTYFTTGAQIDDLIDELVSTAFFSDLSVSEIVKIHMELMEEFSNQLKLEGRSEEVLLDYRLTLIDVIAHLCEMYRRSIPREV